MPWDFSPLAQVPPLKLCRHSLILFPPKWNRVPLLVIPFSEFLYETLLTESSHGRRYIHNTCILLSTVRQNRTLCGCRVVRVQVYGIALATGKVYSAANYLAKGVCTRDQHFKRLQNSWGTWPLESVVGLEVQCISCLLYTSDAADE